MLFVFALFAPLCAAQAQTVQPRSSDANILVLEVRLDHYVVSEGLTAYQAGTHVLLPLGELARLLTLAIRTQPEQGTASGFVLREDRTFYLNVAQATVTLSDRTETVDLALVQVYPDDIYVSSQLVARWLPLDLEIDFSSLALKVGAREPLPLQQRLERERRARQAKSSFLSEDPGYPRHDLPYALWDTPSIDHTLGVEYRNADGRSLATGRHTTFITGDLLGMESALFVTGTDRDRYPDFRLTLGRNDPAARLLGPLHARSFAFGGVPVPGLANVARSSATGNGLAFSNAPLTRPLSFDRHSFYGDLPPGWDVELYFNDALIGFQRSRADGKYNFDDVPLVYGQNEFRLVFHGPQGQLRVKRQSFLLEESLTRAGEFYYRVAAHRDTDGNPRSIAQFDAGLNRHLSATGGLTTLPLQGVQRSYSNLGLRAQWGPAFFNSDVTWSEGGSLADFGLQTRIGDVRLGLSHTLARNFSSEVFLPDADPVRMRDKVRIDGAIPWRSTLRLPFTFELKRDELRSGLDNLEMTGRVSAYLRGTSVTNQLRWQSTAHIESADGLTSISSRFRGLDLRGQVSYGLRPVNELTAVALAATQSLAHGYVLNAGIERSLSISETRYTIGLNKTIGSYGLGIGAGYSSRGEITINGQVFIAMAKEPRQADWLFDAQPTADTGAVSARIFVDKNLNGVMDAGDEPVKGAAFTVNGGRHPVRSDANGIAYLRRLPVRQHVDIGIDTDTLEDPQWLARPSGVRLVPRPGKVSSLDFPVILTGEIDGTVYLLDDAGKRGIGDVALELVDEKGKVVSRAKSASDGFYIVPSVPPGNYSLRLSRSQLNRLGLTDTGMRLLTISPDGTFANGVDFIVIPDRERSTPRASQEPRTVTKTIPATPRPERRADSSTPGARQRYYIVKKGDWLWSIARTFYGIANTGNASKILAANLGIIRADGVLQPGQRITIPPDAPPSPTHSGDY